MNQKESTKTFIMILNWKNPLVSMVYTKLSERFKVTVRHCCVVVCCLSEILAHAQLLQKSLGALDTEACRPPPPINARQSTPAGKTTAAFTHSSSSSSSAPHSTFSPLGFHKVNHHTPPVIACLLILTHSGIHSVRTSPTAAPTQLQSSYNRRTLFFFIHIQAYSLQ